MTTGKTIALTIWTFVGKVMSLIFNTLSRFVIAFLPRSRSVLISWLQSSSTVILEPFYTQQDLETSPKKNPLEIIKQIQYNFRVKNQCTKRSIAFLHANNELEERNVKKTIPFTITTKKK